MADTMDTLQPFELRLKRPVFVPYAMVWNPKREKYDKIPHNGARKLSTSNPNDWTDFESAAAVALKPSNGLSGIGVVMTEPIIYTDEAGITWQLVGMDFDGVTGPIELLARLNTYVEPSPSCTGIRAFAWVRAGWLAKYRDTTDAKPGNCDHLEIYFSRAPRFLTLTFKGWGARTPIAHLDDEQQEALGALLKPFTQADLPVAPCTGIGTPIDLAPLELDPLHRRLLAGARQPEIDRDKVVNSLLKRLIDYKVRRDDGTFSTFTQEDILATLINEPALWCYLLDHRNNNVEKAMEFANRELAVAFNASMTGQLAARFDNPLWKVVDLPEKEVAVSAETPNGEKTLCIPLPDFLKKTEEVVFFVEHLLKKGVHNAVLGHPNAGKTAIILALLLNVALGFMFGKYRTLQTLIVYIAGEDPEGIRLRVKLWCQAHGVDPEELRRWFQVVEQPVLYDDAQTEKFIAELRNIRPGIICVDTFSANYGGDNEDKATEVMAWFRMIRRDFIAEFDCTVLTLHQPPKGSLDVHNWCGSSAASRDLDGVWGVTRVGDSMTLSQGKRRGAEFEPMYFEKKTHIIDGLLDNFGNPVTSVFVVPSTRGPTVDMTEALICIAINTLINVKGPGVSFTHQEIAWHCKMKKNTVTKRLARMKEKSAERGRLIGERGGILYLTDEGKNLATMEQADPEAIERARKGVFGDDEEA